MKLFKEIIKIFNKIKLNYINIMSKEKNTASINNFDLEKIGGINDFQT